MIRGLREEDVPALASLLRAVHRDYVTSERALRHNLEANRDDRRRNYWVAEVDGEIVGRARASFETFSTEQDVGRLTVSVLPERRRRGIGSALYARAEEHLVREGARRIVATAEGAASRPFLERCDAASGDKGAQPPPLSRTRLAQRAPLVTVRRS